jgi:hypothetical protein
MTYTLEDYLVGLHEGQWFGWSDSKNKVYANLVIHDDTKSKPSEADCNAGVAALQADYDAQDYARKRKTEYPTIQECVHAILDDDLAALQVKRQAVKDKYPKE